MNLDVLTTKVADGIAVITLGSAGRIYFDAEMGDALTEALDGLAGDTNVRVVVVTGGAPGSSSCALPVASGPRTQPTTGDSLTRPWRSARACQSQSSPPSPARP